MHKMRKVYSLKMMFFFKPDYFGWKRLFCLISEKILLIETTILLATRKPNGFDFSFTIYHWMRLNIETKNRFDLNVQAGFEISKGLYCVGDPPKRYPVELELKIKFSAESWGEIRPNFKRLVYYACRTKFLFWWPITLQNCKPLISKWMISNKTHLKKKKKKINSQYFQQHFRHLGQIVIDESIKFPITSFIC